MHVVLFGDLQAHPWQEGQVARRWLDHVNALKRIRDSAYSFGSATPVVFLGDLFESKRLIRSDVASLIYKNMGFVTHLVCGNHDIYKGMCSLLPITNMHMNGGGLLFQAEAVVHHRLGFPAAFVPFGATKQSIEVVANDMSWVVAFTHADIEGAYQAAGIRTQQSTLPPEFFEAGGNRRFIFNGHYHRHQVIQKNKSSVPVVCVGAPLCHSWADCDDTTPRGYVTVEIKWGIPDSYLVDWEHVPLTEFPRFYSTPGPHARPLDFVLTPPADPAMVQAATVVHGNVDDASSMDLSVALEGYLSERYPNMTAAERDRLVALGVQIAH